MVLTKLDPLQNQRVTGAVPLHDACAQWERSTYLLKEQMN